MKLMFAPGACSLGIHLLLEEIGTPYDTQRVNLQEGAQYKPDFTTINPKSKVPTLVRDDGTVMTDEPVPNRRDAEEVLAGRVSGKRGGV